MSTKPHKLAAGLKLLSGAAVLGAAAYALSLAFRPLAIVEPVIGATAIDAKPGNVTVTPEYSMELKSEFGGRVLAQDFNLDPGREVKAGDVLARLDPEDLQLAIEKDENDYRAAREQFAADHGLELQLESAHADLDNCRRMNKLGGFSDLDLAKQEREVKMLEQKAELEKIDRAQKLATFENTLKVERRKLDHLTIRAFFDGIVSAVEAHPGDLIGPGASLATLITKHRVVEARISEEDFAKVRVGERASVTFIPYGSWLFDATVVKILPTADPETQRHIVHLEVKVDARHPLVPGINGEVGIVVDEHAARAVVPRRAVFTDAGDNVYVVKDGRVELRKVKKGFVWTTGVEIVEGLSPGDEVIVESLENFHDGERVRARRVSSDALGAKT